MIYLDTLVIYVDSFGFFFIIVINVDTLKFIDTIYCNTFRHNCNLCLHNCNLCTYYCNLCRHIVMTNHCSIMYVPGNCNLETQL